jgi:hypothetical protein
MDGYFRHRFIHFTLLYLPCKGETSQESTHFRLAKPGPPRGFFSFFNVEKGYPPSDVTPGFGFGILLQAVAP